MSGNTGLGLLVLWPIVGALIGYLIGRKNKICRDYFADVVVILEFVFVIVLYMTNNTGTVLRFQMEKLCGNGLFFTMDGFRAIYAVITAFMWMMTTIFSREYLTAYKNRNRYYLFILLTLGATMGVFLSADLFTTFVFFEIMSFTSYVWVAHEENKGAMRAANTYLAVAIIGGLVTLMGLFILYSEIGTLQIDVLLEKCRPLLASAASRGRIITAGVLILVGFGAKAGMFPLHIWLPKAHPVAPAPASALLSGILTKAGVFGVLVISSQIFLHDSAWGMLILILGVITMFWGAFLAVFSVNLKRTLACSSMSQIGFIMVAVGMQGLLGSENALAVRGALLHMVNHSLFKLLLFMIAGVVFMNLHKLHLNDIRGFGRKKPFLMITFLIGALGISGIPLWSGYISKTLIHESITEYMAVGQAGALFQTVEWIFIITGGLTIGYMTKLFVAIFVEKHPKEQKRMNGMKHYMNWQSLCAVGGAALPLAFLGLFPNQIMDRIADMGQDFMHGEGLTEAVHYFSWTNLSGALKSILIGAAVYGLIRLLLMRKNEDDVREYVDRWPQKLDLENLVYRPILLYLLPNLFAFISRCLEYLVDSIIMLFRKTTYSDVRVVKKPVIGTRFSYVAGRVFDGWMSVMNRTFFRKNPREHDYVEKFAQMQGMVKQTNRIITASISFGLMMFCIGFILTIVYFMWKFV